MNGGNVKNQGVELTLSWNDQVNDFSYGVSLNGSYNKNEVTKLANAAGIINGPTDLLSQGTDYIYRLQVGEPMGFFYVYKTDGILQNQAEANAYNEATGSHAIPGDMRFVDTDKDGKITPEDRTNIGNSIPTTRLGFSINMEYKGFDLSVIGTGAFGHLIAKSYRRFSDSSNNNFTTDVFNRWTGEGTSNKWPRLSRTNHELVSDFFFEKGDYVRIQNIILGYDFKRLAPQLPLSQARLYVSAQNLFTFTGYTYTGKGYSFFANSSEAAGEARRAVIEALGEGNGCRVDTAHTIHISLIKCFPKVIGCGCCGGISALLDFRCGFRFILRITFDKAYMGKTVHHRFPEFCSFSGREAGFNAVVWVEYIGCIAHKNFCPDMVRWTKALIPFSAHPLGI